MVDFITIASKVANEYTRQVFAENARIAIKQKHFQQMLDSEGTFGILSAHRPKELPKSENQDRHVKLVKDLQKRGYHNFHTLTGQWDGVAEKSIMVPNMDPKDLFELGKKYEQDSTIYKSKDGVLGMYYPSKKKAVLGVRPSKVMPDVDVKQDFSGYSKTRNWSFEINFDFAKGVVPWDGKSALGRKEVRHAITHGSDLTLDDENDKKEKPKKDTSWEAFLKKKYNGGAKRVPNTNPDTKDSFPNVRLDTLLKNDPQVLKKIQNEWHEWAHTEEHPSN